MYKILIADKMLDEVVEHAKKQSKLDIDYKPGIEAKELLKKIPKYDGLIVRSRTKATKEVLEIGTRLKAIGRAGVGIDNIESKTAKKKGIEVLNTPDATSNTVAEHTLGLLLSLSRHIAAADKSLKEGRWDKKLFMGSEIAGKTIGIMGYGRIGSKIAKKASALGMKVVVYDKRKKEHEANGFEICSSLTAFLKQLDYLSIHVPLNDNTKNLITLKELKKLKKTCYVINCSRGGIVNEADLIKALKENLIAGAAIDVFTTEPKFNKQLVKFKNVVATPHIAASTREAQLRCGFEIVEKINTLFSARKEEEQKHLPRLEVVPVKDIHLHEYFDSKRVGPLAKKIKAEGVFTNPPVVIERKQGKKKDYLILDGSNRTESLKKLGVPHALVQIVDYNDHDVFLKKWNHGIDGFNKEDFLKKLKKIPGFINKPEHASEMHHNIETKKWAGVVIFDETHVYGIKSKRSLKERLKVLNKVVELYHGKIKIKRVEFDDIDEWSDIYNPKQIVVVFPEFTKKELLTAVKQGVKFPSGVTRHLIAQRVLGVNIPLSLLKSDQSLEEKNEELKHFIEERTRKHGGLRYYEESIFVFD